MRALLRKWIRRVFAPGLPETHARLRDLAASVQAVNSRLGLLVGHLAYGRDIEDMIRLQGASGERMDALLPVFDDLRRRFHVERYEFAARLADGRDVLDCACGTGYGTWLLKTKGGARSARASTSPSAKSTHNRKGAGRWRTYGRMKNGSRR